MTKKKTGFNFWERNRLSNGYLLQKRVMKVAISIIRAILLFGLCFLILQPVLNKISVSFMEERDLYDPIVVSIPRHFTIENYTISANPEIMDYTVSLRNSFIVSLTIAILQIAMCTLVGYGFARFKFPFKKFWFAMVILIIVIPPQTISSSLYLHFRFFDIFGIIEAINGEALNLRSSFIPYYLISAGCMGLKNGLYIYMVRQYFRNIPVDLEEAAYIDGCGTLKTFVRIMLPQAKPIITSCFLFAFVWQWTDSFYAKLFFQSVKLVSTQLSKIVASLSVFIARVQGGGSAQPATITLARSNQILSTGTLMIVFPVIFLYLFCQRQFVESIASTGIKM
ncbi:MAG: carbohydrate ABC transporter permease [Lachnospiraceae bacterium]|nr:carbohydrate ABC transporter permease [Lachnospiraceae bacterium]